MRLINADKLYPDCLTKEGILAISQSQIANAPIVGQEKWVDFAKFVAAFVVDEDFKEYGAEVFAELACRKLVKLGLVEIDGDVYKLKEADNE